VVRHRLGIRALWLATVADPQPERVLGAEESGRARRGTAQGPGCGQRRVDGPDVSSAPPARWKAIVAEKLEISGVAGVKASSTVGVVARPHTNVRAWVTALCRGYDHGAMRPGGRSVGVLLAVAVMLATVGSARGLDWSVQPTPRGLEIGAVSCVSPAACAAVGGVATAAGTGAMSWDGRRWRRQSTPDPDPAAEDLRNEDSLSGVSCTASKDCVAVGEYVASFAYDPAAMHSYPVNMPLAERWNGAGWSLLSFPGLPAGAQSGELDAISCTPDRACVAVGAFNNPDGLLAERWDGNSWSMQSMPAPAAATLTPTFSTVSGLSCLSSRFCVAVGSFSPETFSGEEQTFAERWDGSGWSLQPTPQGPGAFEFSSVSCTSASACTAVGWYSSAPSLAARTLAERWNGTNWSIQRTPDGPGGNNFLDGISCVSGRECVAVGSTDPTSGAQPPVAAPLVERWDGKRWSVEHTPNAGSRFLASVSCTSRTICTAVGSGVPGELVEQSAPATAKLTGIPAGCTRGRLTLHLRGVEISSVVWSLDGKTVRGHRVDRGALYAASLRLSPGRNKLNVKVTFEPSSETPAATVRRTVVACASAA
jgi:hypothetical protein